MDLELGIQDVSIIMNRRKIKIQLEVTEQYIYFRFGFNKPLMAEIKESMESPHWCGYDTKPSKRWRVANSPRSRFRLAFLRGLNPYASYDMPLNDWHTDRPLYDHQKEMAAHWYQRHYCMYGCEMGTGKTLAAFDVAERVIAEQGLTDAWKHVWYVGPKTGVAAITRELVKWNFKFVPRTFTYAKLTSSLKEWAGHLPTPRILIVDECSMIKTPTSQRSQAVRHLVQAIHNEHGMNGYVVLMSGTPAPKNPSDWHNQADTACPGFLREGHIQKFKNRLCLVEDRESAAGGMYPHIITWLDDENKCAICGEYPDDSKHQQFIENAITGDTDINPSYHAHKASTNEVAFLYERLKGLVLVKFKKECLGLPDKIYQIINIKPTVDTLRAAKLIKSTSARAITALTRLRELSDGFQYTEEIDGYERCHQCGGEGSKVGAVSEGEVDVLAPQVQEYEFAEITCDCCGGKGEIPRYKRARDDVYSPKDDALKELMADQFEQYGRIIIWAGFTGTIDKLVVLCKQLGWAVLRYDARTEGYDVHGDSVPVDEFLDAMDGSHPKAKRYLEKYPKLAFIGNPRAGGMGLTLTASPGAVYYSNDFSGEARIQSEDRGHRAGMDVNRGFTIYDMIHLPTDQLVLDNLKEKRKLQALTMGELVEYGD